MTSRSPTLVTIDTSMRRQSLALAIGRGRHHPGGRLGDLNGTAAVGEGWRVRRSRAASPVAWRPSRAGKQRHAHQHSSMSRQSGMSRTNNAPKSRGGPEDRCAPPAISGTTMPSSAMTSSSSGIQKGCFIPGRNGRTSFCCGHDIGLSWRAKSTKRQALAEIPPALGRVESHAGKGRTPHIHKAIAYSL